MSQRLTESASGVFTISATPFAEDGALDLASTDPSGRTTRLETWASSRFPWIDWGAYLTATGADADPWNPHIAVPLGRRATST